MPGPTVRFHAAIILVRAPSSAGTALAWLSAHDRIGDAARAGRAEVEAGRAVRSFVVSAGADGRREVLVNSIYPARDRRAVMSYLEVLAAVEQGGRKGE